MMISKNYIKTFKFIRLGRANGLNKVCVHKIVQCFPQE